MKKFLFLLASLVILIHLPAQVSYPNLNIKLISKLDPETALAFDSRKYSGCWGWYQASKNKEYAIVGTSSKTYFIDVTNPNNPQIKDSVMARSYLSATSYPCTWRELKTYQNYCYVASDVCTDNSFQIIDMQYLPDSVHVVYDDSTYFERAHTIWIDGNKLYAGGNARRGQVTAGMKVYSLANPTAPLFLRDIQNDFPSIVYVHDMFVRRDTVYASAGSQGLQVVKYNSGLNKFQPLGSLTSYTESGYNHSSYLTDDGKTLVFCDETPNTSIKIANVSNLSNITMSSITRPNYDPNFVAHNPYVMKNQWAFVSCYQDGLMLYDISNPTNPIVKGFFDTYPQGGSGAITDYAGTSYRGNWGCYPYLPSGLIIACDMQNGIFLLQANSLLGTSVGVKENENKIVEANIYPNPASDKLNITFANNNSVSYTIEISDVLGEKIYSEKNDNDHNSPYTFKTLNISSLVSGSYFIKITNGERTHQQKLIISK